MKRIASALIVIGLSPLIMGGGMNPPSQTITEKITGPSVSGVFIVDTHAGPQPDPNEDDGVNRSQNTYVRPHNATSGAAQFEEGTKHKFAALRLQKGNASASTIFRLPAAFLAFQGCDVTLTEERFVYSTDRPRRLKDMMPPDLVNALFMRLGIDLAASGLEPVITDVSSATCTPDPDNTAETNPFLTNPGILSMQVVIQFVTP
jgi:hypothetical protein